MIELKPKTWNYNLETTFFSYLRERDATSWCGRVGRATDVRI